MNVPHGKKLVGATQDFTARTHVDSCCGSCEVIGRSTFPLAGGLDLREIISNGGPLRHPWCLPSGKPSEAPPIPFCPSRTPDSRLGTPDSGLRTPDSGLPTRGSGLRTPGSGLPTRDSRLRTADSGLRTRGSRLLSTSLKNILPIVNDELRNELRTSLGRVSQRVTLVRFAFIYNTIWYKWEA